MKVFNKAKCMEDLRRIYSKTGFGELWEEEERKITKERSHWINYCAGKELSKLEAFGFRIHKDWLIEKEGEADEKA